jgi:hypothetical protein
MIGFSVNMVTAEEKGKVKVLTSVRAKQDGSVDPARQVTVEQVHKEVPRILKSQIEVGESSKPRVTSRILLNKWHVSKRKSVTTNKSTKRTNEDMRKKCIKRTSGICARTRVRALGMCFLQALLE